MEAVDGFTAARGFLRAFSKRYPFFGGGQSRRTSTMGRADGRDGMGRDEMMERLQW